MSTKTTFKRVALVAVAALGFGVLSSVAPATAAVATSFSLNTSSETVVSSTGVATDSIGALIRIKVTSDATAGVQNVGSLSAGETITAKVTAAPAARVATGATTPMVIPSNGLAMNNAGNDLAIVEQKGQTSGTATNWTTVSTGHTAASSTSPDTVTALATAPYDGAIGSENTSYTGQVAYATDTASSASRYYYVSIMPREGRQSLVMDAGVYTITFTLTDANGNLTGTSTLKIDFVSSKLNSGSLVTIAQSGQFKASTALTSTASSTAAAGTPYISATLTNRDGGVIRGAAGAVQALTTTMRLAAATSDTATSTAASDAGGASDFGNATDKTLVGSDGVFGITWDATSPAAAGTYTLTVKHGSAVATASIVVISPTSATAGTGSITAAGQIDSTDAATVPLTTKSAVVSYTVLSGATPVTGYAVYYTYSYGASCSAGDMTTAVTTPTKVLTDATGVASFTVANAYPLTGCTATVSWTGAASDDNPQVITWAKAAAASAISSPGGNVQVALKSTNKTTWTIVDQFGAVVAGATVQISHTGANAPTVAPATVVSDASGQVSYSFTDALGVAASTTLGTDTVSIASVNTVAPTVSTGAITYTYKTTLDVVASLYSTYTLQGAAAVLVPTTVLGAPNGFANSGLDQFDWTKANTSASISGQTGVVGLTFTAKSATPATVTGIPTTITVSNGYLLGSDNKLTTTRTMYANETVYVVGAKTGTAVVTAKNGTLTSTASILFVNANTDARVLTATESAGTISAKVTDFQGNPVAGVVVTVALSGGAGRLGNGATSNTYTTALDGTVAVDVNGAATATVSISSTKSGFLAGYGDASGSVVTTGAPAGVSKVTVVTAGNTKVADAATAATQVATDTAQAAADAAAEATDAANAATDAANAAAEAADAATAAAQDAADALAALSAQVADLISGLKAQLTALTNLVINIQKKVKA